MTTYKVGKITIKTNNAKLAASLVRIARKPVKRKHRSDVEFIIDRHCDELVKKPVRTEQRVKFRLNAGFEAKLRILKDLFKGRRFRRRDAQGLKLSEIEKQVLHYKYGINFRTLNDYRAQAWSHLSMHKLAEVLRE